MPEATPFRHPRLGAMIRLEAVAAQPLSLTAGEARTIALAMRAVHAGRSAETEIFLSPIASDEAFVARVEADGLRCVDLLDWPQVEALAARLLDLAQEAG